MPIREVKVWCVRCDRCPRRATYSDDDAGNLPSGWRVAARDEGARQYAEYLCPECAVKGDPRP